MAVLPVRSTKIYRADHVQRGASLLGTLSKHIFHACVITQHTICHFNHFEVYDVVAFSIVTVLCNPDHSSSRTFSSPRRESCVTKQSLPVPVNHYSAFSLSGFAQSAHFIKRSPTTCGLCVWLSSLSMFSRVITLLRVSLLHSFLWVDGSPLYGRTTFYLSTYQWVGS